jgi:hypothetical protein
MPPLMDGRGWWEIWTIDGKIRLLDQAFTERESILLADRQSPGFSVRFKSYELDAYWSTTWLDDILSGVIIVNRLGEKSVRMLIPISKEERPIFLWNRLCLFRTELDRRYRGYLIDSDGGCRVLEDAEVVSWLLGQSKAFSYKGGLLYYGTTNLKGSYYGFDDDLNLYAGPTVYPPTGGYIRINFANEDLVFFSDHEGNFWQIGWTEDKAKNPILYYAGRDWGYLEPPKKAVTTDSGLRIRLRASTDAYVLGSLAKGESITILKTGETVTIGGITAPWYRIKKADGLIGWAFGGYIKVLE